MVGSSWRSFPGPTPSSSWHTSSGRRSSRPRSDLYEEYVVTDARRRLAEPGPTLPPVSPALAAYVPAVRSGSYVYVSGQLPMADGRLIAVGKVGAEVSPEQAKELAARCALNGLAAI